MSIFSFCFPRWLLRAPQKQKGAAPADWSAYGGAEHNSTFMLRALQRTLNDVVEFLCYYKMEWSEKGIKIVYSPNFAMNEFHRLLRALALFRCSLLAAESAWALTRKVGKHSRGLLLRPLTSCVQTDPRDTLAQKSLQIARAGINSKWASFARNIVEQIQCLWSKFRKVLSPFEMSFALSKFIRPSWECYSDSFGIQQMLHSARCRSAEGPKVKDVFCEAIKESCVAFNGWTTSVK